VGAIGSEQGPVEGCCGCGDETSSSCAKELVITKLTNSMAQEPEGSSQHSQQPATGPCPETVEFNPHPRSQSPLYQISCPFSGA
jgi:hypothetical protein